MNASGRQNQGTLRPLIIPVFLSNRGCPHRCVFCDSRALSGGAPPAWTEEAFHAEVAKTLCRPRRENRPREIAFYGGNFTGLDRQEQERLLGFAGRCLKRGDIDSIRVSTRPDYVDPSALTFLKARGVKTVEIGAQIMDDGILARAGRGHTSADVRNAVAALKSAGFETGVHLMTGLPGDSPEIFRETVRAVADFEPHMVRIHPTIVFAGTALADLYRAGLYRPLSLEEAVTRCKEALVRFEAAGIRVIRLGLQTTPEMEAPGKVLAGPCHPAFRSLVESALFFDLVSRMADNGMPARNGMTAVISPGDYTSFVGLKRENLVRLARRHGTAEISIRQDPLQPRGTVTLVSGGHRAEGRITDLYAETAESGTSPERMMPLENANCSSQAS